ncbi:hypothetical protein GGI43DRAFT_399710 [Trichoderma evansii]
MAPLFLTGIMAPRIFPCWILSLSGYLGLAITFTAVCTLILCLGFGPVGIGAGNYCCRVSIIHVWSLRPSRWHFHDFDEHGHVRHNDASGGYSCCGNRHRRGYTRMGLGHRQMIPWLQGLGISQRDWLLASMRFTRYSVSLQIHYFPRRMCQGLERQSYEATILALLELHDYTRGI